jgi:hypothetical protein
MNIGDIVQVNPDKEMFGACLVVVTEVKSWGIQGYVQNAGVAGQAYIRLKNEDFEHTGGTAVWIRSEEWLEALGNPDDMIDAITALRTAIETAEKQEPVAWAVFEGWNAHDLYLPQEYDEALKMAGYKGDHAEVKPLYTTPPTAQPAPVQVSPTDFVDMVMDKEDAIGKPIFWAEWPNKEKNT